MQALEERWKRSEELELQKKIQTVTNKCKKKDQ